MYAVIFWKDDKIKFVLNSNYSTFTTEILDVADKRAEEFTSNTNIDCRVISIDGVIE